MIPIVLHADQDSIRAKYNTSLYRRRSIRTFRRDMLANGVRYDVLLSIREYDLRGSMLARHGVYFYCAHGFLNARRNSFGDWMRNRCFGATPTSESVNLIEAQFMSIASNDFPIRFRFLDRLIDVMNMVIFVMIPPYSMCASFGIFIIAMVRKYLIVKSQSEIILVHFQHASSNFFSDLQMSFLASIFGLSMLFAFSYVGQKIHSDAMDLGNVVYQTKWYRYPLKIQQYLRLMLLRSQQPVHLSGYGTMQLNLRNYVGVSAWFNLTLHN